MRHNHLSFWGRTLDEYTRMFSLELSDGQKILSVADGPSTFNKECREKGTNIVSIDPVYGLSPAGIRSYFEESFVYNKEVLLNNKASLTLTDETMINDLLDKRRNTFNAFMDDLEQHPSHYVYAKLPEIHLPSGSFDLCLCSNFLFLFGHFFDFEFHIAAITEMLRLAQEVRIFPLYNIEFTQSEYLPAIIDHFALEYWVSITTVPYEVFKDGNRMLRIARKP